MSEDVKGECNARLYLGDDYGDGTCTIRCQLPEGHDGPHKEEFEREDKPVIITWHTDERDVCEVCGDKFSNPPFYCEDCWSVLCCSKECLLSHYPLCPGEEPEEDTAAERPNKPA